MKVLKFWPLALSSFTMAKNISGIKSSRPKAKAAATSWRLSLSMMSKVVPMNFAAELGTLLCSMACLSSVPSAIRLTNWSMPLNDAPASDIALLYNSKWLIWPPVGSSSLSSPRTISLIKNRNSAVLFGVHGAWVQVRLFCKYLSNDIKSHTAYTWCCMKTWSFSRELILLYRGWCASLVLRGSMLACSWCKWWFWDAASDMVQN